jgi:hypothetical protein
MDYEGISVSGRGMLTPLGKIYWSGISHGLSNSFFQTAVLKMSLKKAVIAGSLKKFRDIMKETTE